jgi:hypothetical protein
MKKFVLITLLALSPNLALALDDTPKNREAEVTRYLKAVPPSEMMQDVADKIAKTLPEAHRKPFVDMMTKYFDINVLEEITKSAMIKHFSADELKALADFYSSPVGKSAMSKMGDYMADIMPAMQAEMIKAQKKARAATEKK